MGLKNKLKSWVAKRKQRRLTVQGFASRKPRIPLVPIHNIEFSCQALNGGKPLEIVNISTGGIAFSSRGTEEMQAGSSWEGALTFSQESVPVVVEAFHRTNTLIGCGFKTPSQALIGMILRYLRVEMTAVEMITVKSEKLQPDPLGTPHWIHGRNNCELYYVTRGPDLAYFNVTFFGNYVEGGKDTPVRFGRVIDDELSAEFRHKGSSLIRWSPEFSPALLNLCERFVDSIPKMIPAHKFQILEQIRAKADSAEI